MTLVLGKIKFPLKVLRAEVNKTIVLVLGFLVNNNRNWQSLWEMLKIWYHFRLKKRIRDSSRGMMV